MCFKFCVSHFCRFQHYVTIMENYITEVSLLNVTRTIDLYQHFPFTFSRGPSEIFNVNRGPPKVLKYLQRTSICLKSTSLKFDK